MPTQYVGMPFIFCTSNNPNYREKQCNGQVELILPKKAEVFKGPEYGMSKREILAWASRNKYR